MLRSINESDRLLINSIILSEFDTIYNSDSPFTNWIIYEENNNIVGFINFNSIYENSEIEYLYVEEKYRNKGIATKLLNEMIKKLKTEGISNITLEVKCINNKAINFYLKNGFKKVSIRKNYYNGIDAFLMLKSW